MRFPRTRFRDLLFSTAMDPQLPPFRILQIPVQNRRASSWFSNESSYKFIPGGQQTFIIPSSNEKDFATWGCTNCPDWSTRIFSVSKENVRLRTASAKHLPPGSHGFPSVKSWWNSSWTACYFERIVNRVGISLTLHRVANLFQFINC